MADSGGLTDLLIRLDREYGAPAIYVTENVASYLDNVNVKGEVLDDNRRSIRPKCRLLAASGVCPFVCFLDNLKNI